MMFCKGKVQLDLNLAQVKKKGTKKKHQKKHGKSLQSHPYLLLA